MSETGKKPVPGLSTFLRSLYIRLYEKYLIAGMPAHYKRAEETYGKVKKPKVAFFVIHSSVWKCDGLYKKMEAGGIFNPVIVVIPSLAFNEEIMHREMEETTALFAKKGYNVIPAYDKQTGKWLDVAKDPDPAVIVFTNPHEISKPEYSIVKFLDRLTCYIPYTFQISHLYDFQYNQLFHNLLWKSFCQSSMHLGFARKYARNKGLNGVVTGYPGVDIFRDSSYVPADRWKKKEKNIKRIIWAPHHTIGNDPLTYSNFLVYSQVMIDLASKYSDRIQIAFKPHPILRSKLSSPGIWGKEKTDEYFRTWQELKNGQLETGEYGDLFLTSDAMIHDSASFLAEYLAVNKPVLYTARDSEVTGRMNEFGKMAFRQHYLAKSEEDIYSFIDNVVQGGDDPLYTRREEFSREYLFPSDGISATESIYNELARYFD
jgi:hypothetical protein